MAEEEEMAGRRRGPSNKIAVGAYLRRLRERRNLTQAEVCTYAESTALWPLDESTLIRVETGRNFASGEILAILLNIYDGSIRDVYQLLRDAKATKADGVARANALADRTPETTEAAKRRPSMLERIIEIGDDDPEKLIRVVNAIRNDARVDPALLDNLLAYMAGRRSQGQ